MEVKGFQNLWADISVISYGQEGFPNNSHSSSPLTYQLNLKLLIEVKGETTAIVL